jgi:hypothetical protein
MEAFHRKLDTGGNVMNINELRMTTRHLFEAMDNIQTQLSVLQFVQQHDEATKNPQMVYYVGQLKKSLDKLGVPEFTKKVLEIINKGLNNEI